MNTNDSISKTARAKAIIMDVLSDGEAHSVKELRAAIQSRDPEVLEARYTVGTVLYQLSKKGYPLVHCEKELYKKSELLDEVTQNNSEASLPCGKQDKGFRGKMEAIKKLLNELENELSSVPTCSVEKYCVFYGLYNQCLKMQSDVDALRSEE